MPYRWLLVALLWLVCLFNYADRQAIFSVFPLLKQEMGLSDSKLGLVGSSFMWVYALTGPLAGLVGDSLRRKPLIIGGLGFWSMITLLTALSTKYSHLVAFRALEGLGEAFYFPASLAMIAAYHGPESRSRAMSWHQSSVYVGTITGGTAAGVCGQFFGWRSGFYLFGALGLLLALVLIVTLRDPPPPPQQQRQAAAPLLPWTATFRHPLSLLLIAVFVGANFVAMIFLTWMPSFLGRKFGMSLAMAGWSATGYLQIASVLGVLTGGVLADNWARRRADGRIRTQALGLLAGVPFLFLTGWTLSVPLLIVAMTGFGFCKGLYDANIWAALYDVVPASRRSTALGVMNSIGWLGGGCAPIAIAWGAERFGFSACLSATSIIYLSLGLALLAGGRLLRASPLAPIHSQTSQHAYSTLEL